MRVHYLCVCVCDYASHCCISVASARPVTAHVQSSPCSPAWSSTFVLTAILFPAGLSRTRAASGITSERKGGSSAGLCHATCFLQAGRCTTTSCFSSLSSSVQSMDCRRSGGTCDIPTTGRWVRKRRREKGRKKPPTRNDLSCHIARTFTFPV